MGKKGIIFLLVLLLIGWIGATSYVYVCKIRKDCNTCSDCDEMSATQDSTSTNENVIEIAERPAFMISDGESFSIYSNQNITFSTGNSDITIPDSLASNFAKLAEFLNNNEQKTLTIEGHYASSEPSDEETGLNRANALKDILINHYGVNTSKITTKAVEANNIFSENNRTIGPLAYSITSPVGEIIDTVMVSETENTETVAENNATTSKPSVDEKVLRKVKRRYTMYYAPNSDYVNSTSEMERYFKYLTKYFKQNPDGLIEIKGYSDVEDNEEGIKREAIHQAEIVKKYLVKEHNMNPRNLRTRASTTQIPQYDDLDKAKNRKIVFSLIK